ncbi:MAG: hypothetical protein C4555_07215 [Dehalococcoidia bacterium]|nr:MAG: hypothetical protein C4555_07215 [Dehalococcoidia bacterium]
MKSLKDELSNRLQKIKDERNQLAHRFDRLTELEQAIELLIKEEDLRAVTTQLSLLPVTSSNGQKEIGRTEIGRFILNALADGKPRPLSQLVEIAEAQHINFQGKKPGRVLHRALWGMRHNGYTQSVGKSVWQITEKAQAKVGIRAVEDKQKGTTIDEMAATVAGH